ncbi:MAG: hypothetical protein LBO72_08295 [Helicobacteraceae bacterium]|jgi:alpha-tubulin suppressor-like RCC1 family protein|nr:hypothetical protein [Helicobacteraceae bacterium]
MSQDETPKASQNRREEIAGVAVLVALIIGAIAYFVGYENPIDNGKRPIVATGEYHSLALTSEGKLYAAGDNFNGQLGLGDTKNRNAFTLVSSLRDKEIVAIAAGYAHSLALDSGGKLYATGFNADGQLGLGDKIGRETWAFVSSLKGKKIVAVAASFNYSLALDSEGKIYAAGYNRYDSIGLGDNANNNLFTLIPPFADKKIVAIAAYFNRYLAIDSKGKLYATGSNDAGQLGLGDRAYRHAFTLVDSLEGKKIVAVATGTWHSLALTSDGKVYATGSNANGQLGLGDKIGRETWAFVSSLSDKRITRVAAGHFHSLALDSDGNLYAAGYNHENRLGFGDNANNNLFTLIPPFADKKIVEIATNHAYSLALDSDGKIYATGCNDLGQLGLRDNVNRKTWTLVSATTNNDDAISLTEGKCDIDYLGFGDRYDLEKFAFAPLLKR